jgi:hypothetical protein
VVLAGGGGIQANDFVEPSVEANLFVLDGVWECSVSFAPYIMTIERLASISKAWIIKGVAAIYNGNYNNLCVCG